MRPRVLARLLQIQRALVRHGLDDFVRATHLYRPFRFLAYLSPWTWFQRSIGVTRGERLRLALEELGPIFVKFGQALSTRRDLLPADIADELAKLQDRVPPFDSAIAMASIEKSFGLALGDIFGRFDTKPLAAASIAQVHVAALKDGREVVVKILRPGMREIIDLDLEVLHYLAELADEYWGEARRLRPVELVREYRKTILDELDLLREAGNAAQLKRNFAGSTLLYVPEVYQLCTRIVDAEGYVHVNRVSYSAPYRLIGRPLEVRETIERVDLYDGPRRVGTHTRVYGPLDIRVTDPAHRPPRGQGFSRHRQTAPEEIEMLQIEPRVANFLQALKQHAGGRRAPLRRLLSMLQEYPREAFLTALASAERYRLFDLDRLEKMVLRQIADDYFVLTLEPESTDE